MIWLTEIDRRSFRLAVKDIIDGISSIHIWPLLGWQEIQQRYRRSILGPFWLTLSTGALIAGMGPLYGRLLNQPIGDYFSYLAIGFVVWILISTVIIESCVVFIAAEGFIKQIRLPFTVHVARLVWKNLIIFGHNFVIVALVLLFFQPSWNWHIWLMPLGVLLIAVNGIWLGLLLGLICARFRDIPQIVGSLVQIAFFLTPVMWKSSMLGKYEWSVKWNPLFHFLEIVRAPLLGGTVSAVTWQAVAAITIVGFALTLIFMARFRSRIAYWV
jgi:ABC-type polysaccharide/polyol phosphate export permease